MRIKHRFVQIGLYFHQSNTVLSVSSLRANNLTTSRKRRKKFAGLLLTIFGKHFILLEIRQLLNEFFAFPVVSKAVLVSN